ncbi:MAG: 2-hydroxyacid dehydrogenase [Candidatus Sericytochromatia bacterium]
MARPRLWLSQNLEAGLQAELAAFAELCPAAAGHQMGDCDAALSTLGDRLDAQTLSPLAGSRLKIIAQYAVGYDNIDLQAATRAGIWVSNTPDVLTEASAEMAWALLFAVARRVVEGDALARSGQWTGWTPTQLLGTGISGKTLGIVGAGRIGQAMARMGSGFGLKLLYFNRSRKPDFEATTGARYCTLPELMAEAQLISLHLPGGPDTTGLIDAAMLAQVQPGTILVNTGRGNSLDETALVAALHSGRLAGVGLDVYAQEPTIPEALRALPQVVLTPHTGSATVAARRAMGAVCLRNIRAALAGETPPQALNPDL